MTNTFIVREAKSAARPAFKAAAAKPWGLYIMKIGRNLHEIGRFETCEQAISLANILAEERGDVRVDQPLRA